jgi:hypothetical protein
MVLSEKDKPETNEYCKKIIEKQSIKGFLKVEQRCLDNQLLFYYDITAKQSMNTLLDKTVLSYDKFKQLFIKLICFIENLYEYLLSEEDIILAPEYIYLDITSYDPSLCYYPGYSKNIKEQMNSLLEYLMNKVDYSDKEAVLLVYRLYSLSREEGFTFEHLLAAINNSTKGTTCEIDKKSSIDKAEVKLEEVQIQKEFKIFEKQKEFQQEKVSQVTNSKKLGMTVVMEKLEGEEEVEYYPAITYLYSGICMMGAIGIIILGFSSEFLYNSFGNRIDYSKLFAMFLITFCIVGYVLKKIWSTKNKISKIVIKKEYVDPSKEEDKRKILFNAKDLWRNQECAEKKESIIPEPQQLSEAAGVFKDYEMEEEDQEDKNDEDKNDEDNEEENDKENEEEPTVLLSETESKTMLLLKPIDELHYQSIHMNEFPFFIGKLKKNMDFCLENEAISRYHAKITNEGEQYFITDLNSKNGTFLNNAPLQTYQPKVIEQDDEISFANIKYKFVISNI